MILKFKFINYNIKILNFKFINHSFFWPGKDYNEAAKKGNRRQTGKPNNKSGTEKTEARKQEKKQLHQPIPSQSKHESNAKIEASGEGSEDTHPEGYIPLMPDLAAQSTAKFPRPQTIVSKFTSLRI